MSRKYMTILDGKKMYNNTGHVFVENLNGLILPHGYLLIYIRYTLRGLNDSTVLHRTM